MSPPLADPESDHDTETPVKPKRISSDAQRAASVANGRLSRGPGPEAKKRTRYNARKHDLRAESELLPGEDGTELLRRLTVWPEILQAETELETFTAQRLVHLGWRMERAERSEEADIERRTLAIAQVEEDRQVEESRLLGLELDSDVDPAGVVDKLLRTPAGCTLLLDEWTNLYVRTNHYNVVVWSQRERLFHLLGKRLRDLFTVDPVIGELLTILMGTVFGDSGELKALALGEVLEGLRPDWMDDDEFQARMAVLADQIPDVATATERLRAYMDEVMVELNDCLEQARANARHLQKLDREAAWVDDTPEGARRLNYTLGHRRAFDATHRRLQALQKDRQGDGGSKAADSKEHREPATAAAAAPSPVVETTTESVVTDDPLLTATAEDTVPVTKADTLGVADGPSDPITNDPDERPMAAGAADAVTKADTLGVSDGPSGPITNDPEPGSAAPNPEIRNPKPEIRNPDPQAPSPDPQVREGARAVWSGSPAREWVGHAPTSVRQRRVARRLKYAFALLARGGCPEISRARTNSTASNPVQSVGPASSGEIPAPRREESRVGILDREDDICGGRRCRQPAL